MALYPVQPSLSIKYAKNTTIPLPFFSGWRRKTAKKKNRRPGVCRFSL